MSAPAKVEWDASKYAQYRPTYPQALFDHVFAFHRDTSQGKMTHCADVGCGTGQVALEVANLFTKVTGLDPSETMIVQARENNKTQNASFLISPAETLPLEDHSVDIITVATAMHWFDIPKFFDEAHRVLVKPGGTLAIWCYNLPSIIGFRFDGQDGTDTASKVQAANDCLMEFRARIFEPNQDKKLNLVRDRYDSVSLPFAHTKRYDCGPGAKPHSDAADQKIADSMLMDRWWGLDAFGSYYGTASAFKAFESANPGNTAMADLLQQLSVILGIEKQPNAELHLAWPLTVLLGSTTV